MNRSRIIWGYQEELSSTAGHGECSVGVNRNKKQTRHPARHPTRRTRWRWHETRSRPRLSLPRKWQRRRRRSRSMPTFLDQSWFPATMRSQSLPYVSELDAKPASMPRGQVKPLFRRQAHLLLIMLWITSNSNGSNSSMLFPRLTTALESQAPGSLDVVMLSEAQSITPRRVNAQREQLGLHRFNTFDYG